MMRIRLALIALGAALAVAAACSSSGGGLPGTPTPTPFNPTNCAVVWTAATTSASLENVFILDMPVAQWTAGTHPLSATNLGIFGYHYDLASATSAAVGVSTSGSVSVSLSDLATGDPINVGPLDAQSGGAVLASGGSGAFAGVWSDPGAPGAPTPGTGTINVAFSGSSFTLGTQESYALCYVNQ